MSILISLISILAPLLVLVTPGLIFIRRSRSLTDLPGQASRVILWSISLLTVGSLAFTALGGSVLAPFNIFLVLTVFLLWYNRRSWFGRPSILPILAILITVIVLYVVFAVPFVNFHQGLPTGDSQKSILWANQIISNTSLPDYSQAITLLNRDPVDFYTPGLHSLTALVMQLSDNPLFAVGLFSIILSIAVAVIASGIARVVFGPSPIIIWLAPLLLLTQLRFLRYLREPGYHYQNLVGELLLFGLLFLALSLLQHWSRRDAILALLVFVSLAVTHQFSAFLSVFILAPVILVGLYSHRTNLIATFKSNKFYPLTLAAVLAAAVAIGISLDLHQKIPHLFTTTPHLLSLTPNLTDYTRLMGSIWMITGVIGLILIALKINNKSGPVLSFILSTVIILALSQAPRFGLDIPPVRALFYAALPLSITGAYFFNWLWIQIKQIDHTALKRILIIGTVILIVWPAYGSVASAFQLSHTVRTNSTLLPSQQTLIRFLGDQTPGAVLIDDYNRRSASWLVLSGQPMFTRLASNLERQMNEASQSAKRRRLYLKQLDFEKIFSLASHPAVADLMSKHQIQWLTGIDHKSNLGFSHNPALSPTINADDITLYHVTNTRAAEPNWLLNAATLVNDIGDDEDTFLHLPASLQATRLSAPAVSANQTFRTTTAPYIPLAFNVGDYVRILIDQDNTGHPDASLELVVVGQAGQPDLTIITSTGQSFPLSLDGTPTKLPPNTVPIDDRGFISLTIDNPTSQSINIDLIALGLARTP